MNLLYRINFGSKSDGQSTIYLMLLWPKQDATHQLTNDFNLHGIMSSHWSIHDGGRVLRGCTLRLLLRSESDDLVPPTGLHEALSATTPSTHERTTEALHNPQGAEWPARLSDLCTIIRDRTELSLRSSLALPITTPTPLYPLSRCDS